MLKILTYLILMTPFCVVAQVVEDFSDGDFTDNPSWSGTDTVFVVNGDKQLQLMANTAGSASLFCDVGIENGVADGEFEWRFWLREAFAPSTKNFCDIMLCDKYFVRFGEAGSNDVVELLRIDGGAGVSVCRGTDTFIASAFSAFFKITRDNQGSWKIFVDKDGTGNYVLEAQGVDNTFVPSGRFGINVTFTASNAKKVYLDDVYAGKLIVDTEPPLIKDITVLKYNKVQVDFNEPVDEVFALDHNNYTVDNQLNKPFYAEYNGNNRSSIILSFSNSIVEGVYYTMTIAKIQDLAGNIGENVQFTFLHFTIHENDVVINEIMADPEPVVGLPSCEYVEIYNTTEFPINLKNWTLIIGSSEKIITQDIEIQSDSYILLCKENSLDLLSEFGECVGFTSFSISNSGAEITLKNEDSKLITQVLFDASWYRDSSKADGGWSLEQIDPYSPCTGRENWRASIDYQGGTPGSKNSVKAENIVGPAIDYVDVLSNNSLELYFNQRMDVNSLENSHNYTVVEFSANPYEAVVPEGKTNSVRLLFEQEFTTQLVYNIAVADVLNCSGTPVSVDTRYSFGIPETAEAGDVVINEILFDPISPAADYVEVFNKANKVLNIKDLKLGVVKQSFPNPPDTTVKTICVENRQLLPGGYLLLTTTPDEIANQYECSKENFLRMSSFPSYPNDGATVLLLSGSKVIDFMSYSDDIHYPLLTTTKGVSLERVSPYIASDDVGNWHSTAAPLYGTPGYKNSVFIENTDNTSDEVEILPLVFSPDNDGFDDVTTINLISYNSDYSAKISVFDAQGSFINLLVHGQNIGHQNLFVWDGKDKNGSIVPVGIYVIYIELFDLQGVVKRIKKAVVVASR